MKKYFGFFTMLVAVGVSSCKTNTGEAVDLRTGKTIQVVKDEQKGYMVNAETKKPVYLYVTTSGKDTIYGRTGVKVSNNLVKTSSGSYRYTGDNEYIFRNGDYIIKTGTDTDSEEDATVDNTVEKYKVQGDGDIKIKDGDYKKKIETNGDVKIKDGDTKIKIKDGVVVKVKKD
jgi:hypothetical protein